MAEPETRPYEPIVDITQVASIEIDTSAWSEERDALQLQISTAGEAAYAAALSVVVRAAATETGAIENLYPTSAGMTVSVAEQEPGWELTVEEAAPAALDHIDAQLRTYETILTESQDEGSVLTEAWVRELHKVVTGHQQFYDVLTAVGPQRRLLQHGSYKADPNQVIDRYGRIVMYASPEETPAEMARLFENLRSSDIESAHPVIQATYVHYGITHIHPFADGNGRIARALASYYLLRGALVPLLIFADRKSPYLQALEIADRARLAPFAAYVQERALDAISWMAELLRIRSRPSVAATSAHLELLVDSQDGPPIESYDQAAARVISALADRLDEGIPPILLQLSASEVKVRRGDDWPFMTDSGFRRLDLNRVHHDDPATLTGISIRCAMSEPINVEATCRVGIHVAESAGQRAAVQIVSDAAVPDVSLRAEDVIPSLSAGAQVRIGTFAGAVWAGLMARLVRDAHQVLRDLGRLPVELEELPW